VSLWIAFFATVVSAVNFKVRRRAIAEANTSGEWPLDWFLSHGGASDIPVEDTARKVPFRQKLKNDWDLQYTATLQVGGQSMTTVLDTGSFELLVFSERCLACGVSTGLYSDEQSPTFEKLGFLAEHTFGSGTTTSEEAFDEVRIGPLVSKHQHFWEVVNADMAILEDDFFHAILGMGPPKSATTFAAMNADQVHAELEQFRKSEGDVPESMINEEEHFQEAVRHTKNVTSLPSVLGLQRFSVCLGKEALSPGYFVWNDDAVELEPSKFTTINVKGDIYWSAELSNVMTGPQGTGSAMKSQFLGCEGGKKCTAVLDTGSSLIIAPRSVIDSIDSMLDGWTDPSGDCSDLRGLPDLLFEMNGKQFSMPPESYIGKLTGDLSEHLRGFMPQLVRKNARSGRSCVPLLMASDDELDADFGEMWILGMPFFRKYYASFHFVGNEASTMSFAPADEHCRPAEPTNALFREGLFSAKPPRSFDVSKIRPPRRVHKAMTHSKFLKQRSKITETD
jgi:hypothetical protein